MKQGFVKLYRKAESSGLFSDMKVAGFFAWLLIRVNWKAEKWRGEWVHPGSMITSISHLSGMIYESPKVTRRLIADLEAEGILKREVRANKWTKLTICNWGAYQDLPCSEGKLRDGQRANQGNTKGNTKGNPIKELRINNKKEKKDIYLYTALARILDISLDELFLKYGEMFLRLLLVDWNNFISAWTDKYGTMNPGAKEENLKMLCNYPSELWTEALTNATAGQWKWIQDPRIPYEETGHANSVSDPSLKSTEL